MIRINFLTSFKDYAAAQGVQGISYVNEDEKNQLIKEVAKRFLIIAIGPLAFYLYEMQTIPTLMERKKQAELKLVEIVQFNESKQGLSDEIKRYEDEQTRFNAQMSFINRIQADKVNEYKLFKLLKDSTPKSIWIRKLEFINNNLLINAFTIDPAAITNFTEMLSNTDFLSSPVPIGQTVDPNYKNTGIEAISFDIKASLNQNAGGPNK